MPRWANGLAEVRSPSHCPTRNSPARSLGFVVRVTDKQAQCPMNDHFATEQDARDAASAMNRIARFVEGAQFVVSILASAPATSKKCSARWCFGLPARFGSRRRTVATGEPSARNSAIRAHSSTAVIAAPATWTVTCLPASAIGRKHLVHRGAAHLVYRHGAELRQRVAVHGAAPAVRRTV